MSCVKNQLPDQSLLIRLIEYDPDTGTALWKPRVPSDFSDGSYSAERRCAAFNGAYAGKPTFTCPGNSGQVQAQIGGIHYGAHRIIWKMLFGDEPQEVVAINGNLLDLRLCNLKASAKIYTAKNLTMFSDNTSGVRGVAWDASRNMWKAFIKANDRSYFLGRYADFDQAVIARQKAEDLHGFSRASKAHYRRPPSSHSTSTAVA